MILRGGSPHTDNVTIRAYDADGNEVPIVISPGSDITVSGNNLEGDPDTDGESVDGSISSLIEIAGPIARIEIDYNNGGTGTREVLVSDLLLTTIDATVNEDPDAVDDDFTTEVDTDVTFNVLGNDSDPDAGDTLSLTSVTPLLGSVTFTPAGDVVYTPPGGFIGTDTLTYTISDGNGGTDTTSIQVLVGTPPLDGIVEGTTSLHLLRAVTIRSQLVTGAIQSALAAAAMSSIQVGQSR